MINLNICANCPKCSDFSPSLMDGEGKIIRLPSANCDLGGVLLGNSILPDECPYVLEQTLLEDKAFNDFENLKDEEENEHTS